LGTLTLASPAFAAPPTTNKNTLVFPSTVCTQLAPPNRYMVLDFTVNGTPKGFAPAFTDAGVFRVTELDLVVNGVPQPSQVKKAPTPTWSCNGQTSFIDPSSGQPVTISFTALGNFS